MKYCIFIKPAQWFVMHLEFGCGPHIKMCRLHKAVSGAAEGARGVLIAFTSDYESQNTKR